MDNTSNSMLDGDGNSPVLTGSESPVRQSSVQPTTPQESSGRASRKRRSPSKSLSHPTAGPSPVSPAPRSVRPRLPTPPPSLVSAYNALNTQPSRQPSNPVPPGVLWITSATHNVQHRPSTPFPSLTRVEEAPSTSLSTDPFSPVLSSMGQLTSQTCNAQHCLLEPSSAARRECQVQHAPSRSNPSSTSNLTAPVQPSTSQTVSMARNEQPPSLDLRSISEIYNHIRVLRAERRDMLQALLESRGLVMTGGPQLYIESEDEEFYFDMEEDYTHELQENLLLHDDPHAALRLNIDGMSYEELLALEEGIGNVNTGICSSEVQKFVKEVKCSGNLDEVQSCTICLEDFKDGEVLGQLRCLHKYHVSCIRQWLKERASCPICKCSPAPHSTAD